MQKKILIIGGTRFLGLAIAKPLISKGYEIYEMNRGTRAPINGVVEQIICDKADRATFAEVLKKCSWDVIIDTILSDEDLEFVIETIGSDIGQFIHTGSLGVYGDARQIPAVESMPISEYEGEEVVFNYKIRQDQVIMKAFREQGFPGTIMRMSYIYGPGDMLLNGWGGRNSKFFKMLYNKKTIPLPGDGRALLHPGHVRDLGRSFLHAVERPVSIGQIYNISGHNALMMKDYIAMIAEIMGIKANIEFMSIKEICESFPTITNERGMKFSCQHMCASINKAELELDWRPEIPLEAGLRENIEWMKSQGFLN